jgi:hypothetical protein
MKWALRILALIGATVFGVFSICFVVVDTEVYIEIYKLIHMFPIYRLESDLRDLAPGYAGLCIFRNSLYPSAAEDAADFKVAHYP